MKTKVCIVILIDIFRKLGNIENEQQGDYGDSSLCEN